MKKIVVIFGNISFHHFDEREKALFQRDTEQRALIHEIASFHTCYSDKEVAELIDKDEFESWLIPEEFNGEIVIECMPMIRVEDLIKIV
jgi:hypothetical protein